MQIYIRPNEPVRVWPLKVLVKLVKRCSDWVNQLTIHQGSENNQTPVARSWLVTVLDNIFATF